MSRGLSSLILQFVNSPSTNLVLPTGTLEHEVVVSTQHDSLLPVLFTAQGSRDVASPTLPSKDARSPQVPQSRTGPLIPFARFIAARRCEDEVVSGSSSATTFCRYGASLASRRLAVVAYFEVLMPLLALLSRIRWSTLWLSAFTR